MKFLWVRLKIVILVLVAAGNAHAGMGTIQPSVNRDSSSVQKSRPLIVWMHGCTQSANEFIGLTQLKEKQSKMGLEFELMSPEQSILKNPLVCWNWYIEKNQVRGQGLLKKIVDEVQMKVAKGIVDPDQIYVGGFSAGGVMAAHLAYCYPDVFKAALIHSGAPFKLVSLKKHAQNDLGLKALGCARGVKNSKLKNIIIVHGDKDKIAPPSGGLKAAEQALYYMDIVDDGLDNGSLVYTKLGEGVNRWESIHGYSVNYLNIENMGHAWSGGNSNHRFSSEGTIDITNLFLELIRNK